jgi:hypothetical protein
MGVGIPALAAFVSKFTNLTCGEIYVKWPDSLELNIDETLVPPPFSIKLTNLVLADCGRLPPNVLQWFTDLHPGVIESFFPFDFEIIYQPRTR